MQKCCSVEKGDTPEDLRRRRRKKKPAPRKRVDGLQAAGAAAQAAWRSSTSVRPVTVAAAIARVVLDGGLEHAASRAADQRFGIGIDFDATSLAANIDLVQSGIDPAQQIHGDPSTPVEGVEPRDLSDRVAAAGSGRW